MKVRRVNESGHPDELGATFDSLFVFLRLRGANPPVVKCPVGCPMGGVDPARCKVPEGCCFILEVMECACGVGGTVLSDHDVPVVIREAVLCEAVITITHCAQ